jgi:ubiquinone/menaquinone biosynthesis C-methylase UbiE
MITKARELTPACQFTTLLGTNLEMFPNGQFDFVYSNIVLQHQPHRSVVFNCICEFLRVVRPGGLIVFQLPIIYQYGVICSHAAAPIEYFGRCTYLRAFFITDSDSIL